MLFNSYIFILLFLPIAVIIYNILVRVNQKTMAKVFLIGMSLWFYAYFNLSYLWIILFSVLANYILSRLIIRHSRLSKILLSAGIIINISVIFYYKYFDFFIENINSVFHLDFAVRNILLPLGISFFTFQQISYLVDTYRSETSEYSFVDYALFVTFFPQLVAGPIVTHSEILPQLGSDAMTATRAENLSEGLYRFSVGLAKKVLLADIFGRMVDAGFAIPGELNALETILIGLGYTFQLYLDFSGYSDMAAGIALMFNVRLPQNFNSPYKSVSISDFWARWHMSLTRFLRKYVYIPLGGNRKGTVRTYVNVLIVFLLSGIWHGAGWTFILWGMMHGVMSVLYRLLRRSWDAVPAIIRWFVNFVFVMFGWMMFRAQSLADFAMLVRNLVIHGGGSIRRELVQGFNTIEYSYITEHVGFLDALNNRCPWIPMALFFVFAAWVIFFTSNLYEKKFRCTIGTMAATALYMTWSIVSLSGVMSFLYFNF